MPQHQIPPRYPCGTCQGWGTVVPADGGRPIPCPDNCATARQLASKTDRPAR